MKFTDGFWRIRDGVRIGYATEVRDVRVQSKRFTAYAAVQKVTRRGDTLNAPLLTVDCFSPAEGVIGVRVTHHAGRRDPGPHFALAADPDGVGEVRRDGTVTELTSGPLTLRLDRSAGCALSFHDAGGRELTRAGRKGTAFATTGDGAHHVLAQLSLGVGEQIYGLGERFTPFVKNGQSVDIWQADGGTSSEQAYKNIPFYLSSRGYGVFVDHPGAVSFEVGSESVGQVQFSVEDQTIQYYVVAGPPRRTSSPATPPSPAAPPCHPPGPSGCG